MPKRKSATQLNCPHCSYDGREPTPEGTFRFLEDVTSYHEVKRFEEGTLYVNDSWDLYLEDRARRQRLECRKCFREFPFPNNCEVEYVYERSATRGESSKS